MTAQQRKPIVWRDYECQHCGHRDSRRERDFLVYCYCSTCQRDRVHTRFIDIGGYGEAGTAHSQSDLPH